MSFFDDLCNRHWCKEFDCVCGTNVVIFTADGFIFFGLLDRVEDGVLTLVPAANENDVFVITAGGDIEEEDISYIDVCSVIALSKNVVKKPFHSHKDSNE
ncbi:MAG TPA: hypothetical protein PKA28_03090 [Methylomusa anaerophila]|uniref:Uncharacterized protein n=1 Tax=Methylomusa anaerophila TaxID=1930071 RepID=A0A348ANT8_9FIRM|nr:hypothetical protein [Methylomusa anaerophila]BBB92736.1 hypothetical protein MAMMFC1_03432 [Methylomusa anaerophila]HML87411.1 hypothetical protein [Methylomusa anaerophila]